MAELSSTDWLVLGALATGATHGFAVSTVLAKDGDLGRIWTVKRAMVYQSINKLVEAGLVAEGHAEPGSGGPSRTPLAVTAPGQRVLGSWLMESVPRLRDIRPLLLVKIALVRRLGGDIAPLVSGQREVLATMTNDGSASEDDVAVMIDRWRHYSAEAALGFLDEMK